ncbi:MAG: cellulose biosynthesis protein BcsS, partial [Pseudomonadota bacterium]
SSLTRGRVGASAALAGSYGIDQNWRISASARYVTGFNEVWAQVKPEFQMNNGLRLGITASGSVGDDYEIVRSSLTAGNYSHDFRWLGEVYFSAEAGFEYNIDTGDSGPFGGLHIGFRY